MCDSTLGETMDHPLVSCKMASDLHVSNTSGISNPGSTNADSVRTSWGRACQQEDQDRWAAVAWTLWKEHNRHIFQGERKNLHALKMKAELYVEQWAAG
jgi:hypothetical protein